MFSWITLDHLARWTGGTWTGKPSLSCPIPSISTDSRTLQKGEVFVALQGPSFDGHAFVEEAGRKGALAVIAAEKTACSAPVLIVADTSQALVQIGENIRRAFKGPVFAVTGSAGKSSTKEMLADLMGEKTVRSPKSFNNLWGVPRTLFLLQDDTQNLVLEIGMNALGEIKTICDHFQPSYGLITNIGDAHVGKLGGKENIYQAKKELFDSLAQTKAAGVALNLDDENVCRAYRQAFKQTPQTVTYSAAGKAADVRVVKKAINPQSGALELELNIRENEGRFELPLFGLHQATNIAASCAGAMLLGLAPRQILERLPHLHSALQRGELRPLAENKTLIDESYNSNPSALIASLTSVSQLDVSRRRILVLGEMRELGDFSNQLHAEAGQALVRLYREKKFPFVLVGVGNGFLPFLKAVETELPGIPCLAVPDTEHAVERLKTLVRPSDIILVKGSRGVKLEVVVQWLCGTG